MTWSTKIKGNIGIFTRYRDYLSSIASSEKEFIFPITTKCEEVGN